MKTSTRYTVALLSGFALGYVLAVTGGLAVAMVLATSGLESVCPALGSCKTPAIFGLLIGAPIGCVVGVSMMGRILLPLGRTWLGIVAAFVLYDLAMLATLFVAEKGSSIPEYVVLLFPTALSMVGFYVGCRRVKSAG